MDLVKINLVNQGNWDVKILEDLVQENLAIQQVQKIIVELLEMEIFKVNVGVEVVDASIVVIKIEVEVLSSKAVLL